MINDVINLRLKLVNEARFGDFLSNVARMFVYFHDNNKKWSKGKKEKVINEQNN